MADLNLKTVIGRSEGCMLLHCACIHVCFKRCWVTSVYLPGPFSLLLHPALCPGWLTCVGYVHGCPCPLASRQTPPWEGRRRSEGRWRMTLGLYSSTSFLLALSLLAPQPLPPDFSLGLCLNSRSHSHPLVLPAQSG